MTEFNDVNQPPYMIVRNGIRYWKDGSGLSFRDTCAIAAMQGILSCARHPSRAAQKQYKKDKLNIAGHYARVAYQYADAMEAERSKRNAANDQLFAHAMSNSTLQPSGCLT